MKKLFFCILLFGILTTTQVKADTILYCQTELATGLAKKNGSWVEASFKPKRYTMKFEDDFSKVIIEDEEFTCFDGGEWDTWHPIICKNAAPWGSESLNIDKKSLRYVFTEITIAGYASPIRSSKPDTDVIYAGTCEKF